MRPHTPSQALTIFHGFVISALLMLSSPSQAWGPTGHRIVSSIAEPYLSADARSAISQLLPNESLAEASTYADEMRSDPSQFWQQTASPWHYVTVPAGETYASAPKPAVGDAITALAQFKQVLLDSKTDTADKQLALRFSIHIIGDLHQPLHAGNGLDRGGNELPLQFFSENTNLHRLWDSDIINHQRLSYSEWSLWLKQKISPDDQANWAQTDPAVWVAESVQLRETLYPSSTELGWDYQHQYLPIIKLRLQQAGVRLAAYLNKLFEQS